MTPVSIKTKRYFENFNKYVAKCSLSCALKEIKMETKPILIDYSFSAEIVITDVINMHIVLLFFIHKLIIYRKLIIIKNYRVKLFIVKFYG